MNPFLRQSPARSPNKHARPAIWSPTKNESNSECIICRTPFSTSKPEFAARSLPCSHHFCSSCLTRLLDQSRLAVSKDNRF